MSLLRDGEQKFVGAPHARPQQGQLHPGLDPGWGGEGGVTRTPPPGDGALCWGGGEAHPGCQTAPPGSYTLGLLQTPSPSLLPRPYSREVTRDKCKSRFVPDE